MAASLGFLAWNWPPAKIFMGDVGSGYLGYAIGVLALATMASGFLSPWVWLILGGCFIVDATVTLVVRYAKGAPLTQAHRSHSYQRLSRYWGGHQSVTLLVISINVFWLLPWAAVAIRWPALGFACSIVALVPIVFAVTKLGAGRSGEIADSKLLDVPVS
jgi:Fuc2NAc and GlcNAc transferase